MQSGSGFGLQGTANLALSPNSFYLCLRFRDKIWIFEYNAGYNLEQRKYTVIMSGFRSKISTNFQNCTQFYCRLVQEAEMRRCLCTCRTSFASTDHRHQKKLKINTINLFTLQRVCMQFQFANRVLHALKIDFG